MATYEEASQARELIRDVAGINNTLVLNLSKIQGIRGRLLALSQAQRDIVVAAVTDMGYDPSEIQAMLAQWNAVDTTANAQGVATVPTP